MSHSIGIDEDTDARLGVVQFVILSWADAFKRGFSMDGRTGLRAYWVVAAPLFVLLIALLMWPVLKRTLQLDVNLSHGPITVAIGLVVILYTLTTRRFHDIGKQIPNPLNPLKWFVPWLSIISMMQIISPGDVDDNEYGPPHKLSPGVKKADPKRIG